MSHDSGGYIPGIDPKVSVLGGESLKDYTRFKRSVEASILGCEKDDGSHALHRCIEASIWCTDELSHRANLFAKLAHLGA